MDAYLDRLAEIRRLQDFIVGRAARAGVPVIENGNVERTIGDVIELAMRQAEGR
jgi:2-phosphoglycerate kinase